jgi:hypothetical protein
MAEKNQVTIKAFTGMTIGTFAIESKTSKAITVITKNGELIFDAVTGKQTNAKNPRYANYIDMAAQPVEPKGDAKKQGSKPDAGAAKGGSKAKAKKADDDDIPEA